MSKVNANILFKGLTVEPSFTKIVHIKAGDSEDKLLREARSKIRAALRRAFVDFELSTSMSGIRQTLFEGRDSAFREAVKKSLKMIDVRFLTQGSFVYGTLIRPANPKSQEIDLDDGVYIPMPFVNGLPAFSSNGLFIIIENALKPLVKYEGWKFFRKDTCVRVVMPGSGAHIDLPLFAVEQNAFDFLESTYRIKIGKELRSTSNLNEVLDSTAKFIRLSKNQVMLADRNEDWRVSDPKAIHDWFVAQVDRHGHVLRRLCRYTKAWRDNTWEKSSLSSLALMAICVEVLGDLGERPNNGRDDLLMLKVAECMPCIVRRGKITWHDDERPLDENWTDAQRTEIALEADKLYSEMKTALEGTFHRALVIDHLRNCFGERFPDSPESISIESDKKAEAIIASTPATVALPKVIPSVSA